MNVARTLLAVSVGLFALPVQAQSENDLASLIVGKWVASESLLPAEIEAPSLSSYFKYEFTQGRAVYFATHPYERGPMSRYEATRDKIDMFGRTYTLQRHKADQLELETRYKTFTQRTEETYTTTLIRKEKYDLTWKVRETEGPADTRIYPVFQGNFHLHDYLFSNYNTPNEFASYTTLNIYALPPAPPKEDLYIKITMAIDSLGNVSVHEIVTSKTLGQRKLNKIKNKFINTSGYWLPARRDGKNKNKTLSLTFITRGRSSLQLKNKALELFRIAYASFLKGDYFSAIHQVTDAI
jgi:hypothetical protein